MSIQRDRQVGENSTQTVVDRTEWAKDNLILPDALGRLVYLKQWVDPKFRATGFLARWGRPELNVSGGGIRMKVYETPQDAAEEAIKLAATMSEKFGIAGPEINGSKFVIDFDPQSSEKMVVLAEFVKAFQSDLQNIGTAGDLNVSEQESAAVLSPLGIINPQHGILNSLGITEREDRLTAVMNVPLKEPMGPKHQILVDVTAGWSVAAAVEQYFKEKGESLKGKTIAIQGTGSVGGSAGFYLERQGAKVVAAADAGGSFLVAEKLSGKLRTIDPRTGCLLRGEGIRPIGDPNEILYQEADVLIVAATSGVITEKNQAKVKAPVIFEGANKPISKGAEIALTRRGITVFPDFVANAGTAELFTVGMLADCQIEEETILRLIKNITVNATVELMRLAEEKQISHREAAKVVSTLNLWKQVIYAH